MIFENDGKDPTARRRLSAEAMLRRDIEVVRLRQQGVTFRAIAARLGMSVGSVQKAVLRAAKMHPLDEPNLLEMYRAMRGLRGSEQRAALEEFRVAANKYWRSERSSPDDEGRGYL
jgi:DNA-binding CsgD family transcriptional regulator